MSRGAVGPPGDPLAVPALERFPPSARRVLVTGASGFVGANLCRWLLRDGHSVHAVVRPGTDTWRIEEIRGDITLHRLELRDAEAVRTTIGAVRADWLFHLAAHGAYSRQTDTAAIFATNTDATAGLVDLAGAGAFEAFVQAGSTAEYGFKDHPARESEPVAPLGSYAISKAAATRYARTVSMERGAHIVTLRLSTAYGPWEDPYRLMPALAMFGLRRRLPPLTDPKTVRDFVFVDDVCEAFVRAARATHLKHGSIFNIGSGTPTSLAELVDLARGELAIDEQPRWSTMAPRTWDTMLCVADCARSRRRLGWRPSRGLAEGFRALVDWLERNSRARARYARSMGIPLG
ncbi:NAD-dependent epimerase/dehydratase family protein [Amycolatopsis rhizosphaerae]|uniref:NAD-dependent epimerase/dehydratase family protein n=1 Tax=Amycolatopsis rhizosphaerae TaxID=2053003 RepID=UPI0016439112|nr:NAD-dependent epimerase/dehydratase family protein [Amycolatopsis rhizosphaerae]